MRQSSTQRDLIGAVVSLEPGSQPRVCRRGTPADLVQWWLVPTARSPRMLAPTPGRCAAAALTGRRSQATGRLRATAQAIVASATGHGAGRWLFKGVTARPEPAGLQHWLAELFGQPVQVSITVGSLRSNRKPVLQVFGCDGTAIGYVKVGTTALARRLVDEERAALAWLSQRTVDQFNTPALLAYDDWRGHPVLVMQRLATTGGRISTNSIFAASDRLFALGDITQEALAASTYWARLQAALSIPMGRLEESERLSQVSGSLLDRHGHVGLDFGVSHGDWSRWNMAADGAGGVSVWDWERFDLDMPRGHDVVHYSGFPVLWKAYRSGRDPRDLDQAVGPALHMAGLPTPIHRATIDLYLATMVARYVTDAAMDEGDVSQPIRAFFLRTLLVRLAASKSPTAQQRDVAP